MNVKELIEQLKKYPPYAEVTYYQSFTILPSECGITTIMWIKNTDYDEVRFQ